jgi:hypothetical protein
MNVSCKSSDEEKSPRKSPTSLLSVGRKFSAKKMEEEQLKPIIYKREYLDPEE